MQSYLQSEMFLSNSVDMMKNLHTSRKHQDSRHCIADYIIYLIACLKNRINCNLLNTTTFFYCKFVSYGLSNNNSHKLQAYVPGKNIKMRLQKNMFYFEITFLHVCCFNTVTKTKCVQIFHTG